MFDSIKNLVSGMTPDMKTLVQVVLYFLAFVFFVETRIHCNEIFW